MCVLEKINSFIILEQLHKRDHLSVYQVKDEDNGQLAILRLTDHTVKYEKWNNLYNQYMDLIVNFNYLPKWKTISEASEIESYAVFEGSPGEMLAYQGLSDKQIEQLLDAVTHLHKKKFTHGNIVRENIWIKENEDIVLYGAGEYKLLEPETEIPVENDLKQLFNVIKTHSLSSTENLNGGKMEDLYDWLDSLKITEKTVLEPSEEHDDKSETQPGLIEKGELIESADRQEEKKERLKPEAPEAFEEEITDFPSRPQAPAEASITKRKYGIWVFGGTGLAVLLIFLFSVNLFTGDAEFGSANEETARQQETEEIENLNVYAELFPGWQTKKHTLLQIKDKKFTLIGLTKKEDDQIGIVKAAVVTETGGEWQNLWESGEYINETDNNGEFIDAFLSIPSVEKDKGLLVMSLSGTESIGLSNVYGFVIDENGKGKESFQDLGFGLHEHDREIHIEKIGEISLKVSKGKLITEELPRSQLAPKDAQRVFFKFNENNEVIADGESKVIIEKGETLALIPMDDKARNVFDLGEIKIYSNGIENNRTFGEKDPLVHGNSITFDRTGEYRILLKYYKSKSVYDLKSASTFLVKVKE